MNRSWFLAASLLLFPFPAFAAEKPAVVEVKGDVKIGQEGDWKPAKPGAPIGEADFLQLAPESTVTVKLANGAPATFMGKAFIPGRRLMDPKMTVDGLMRFYKVYQKAATTIGGVEKTTSLAGAGKACENGFVWVEEKKKCVSRREQMMWASSIEEKKSSSDADKMSALYHEGVKSADKAKIADAQMKAKALLDDKATMETDRRRANIVLGVSSIAEGAFSSALDHLDKAAAPIGKNESGAEKYRAQAQLERGKLLLQMGSDARAQADFEAALSGGESAVVSQAHYYLGFMALATNDDETAEKQFAKINDPDWKKIARETRKAAEAN